jgi:hypothetical protein
VYLSTTALNDRAQPAGNTSSARLNDFVSDVGIVRRSRWLNDRDGLRSSNRQ